MSPERDERAAQLDLVAACTASVVRAAGETQCDATRLKRQMLKKIDAWAADHKMSRSGAIHELLARALKNESKTNGVPVQHRAPKNKRSPADQAAEHHFRH